MDNKIKIAQLIIARLNGVDILNKFDYYRSLVEQGIGGLIIFGGRLREVRDGLFNLWYKPFNPADLNWHLIDPSMMKDTGKLHLDSIKRWVNFNTSDKHSSQKQFAIYLQNDGSFPGPGAPDSNGYNWKLPGPIKIGRYLSFPLRDTYKVSVYPEGITRLITRNYKALGLESFTNRVVGGLLGAAVVHEIGHAIGMVHHNDLVTGKYTD